MLKPFDFQIDALNFVLNSKRSHHYLAIDRGLGKTIIAALLINALRKTSPHVVYITCPPFLVANIEAEFLKWGVKGFNILPDTKLAEFKLPKMEGKKILFVDEAHRFCNDKSQRSKALYALTKQFDRVVFMSGTPMPNSRPVELWPALKNLAPDIFGTNFFKYALRYCNAYKGPFGWDFTGFSNPKEFKRLLFKDFMFRLKKGDTNLKLPPKIESLLTVGDTMPPSISALEKKIVSKLADYDKTTDVKSEIEHLVKKADIHVSEYLKLLGEYKLQFVTPYIQNLLTETKENLLVFAYHKAVMENLKMLFCNFNPVVIDATVAPAKRQALVDGYQNSKSQRLMLANILTAGVGLTITKATRVIILEPSWRDGDNGQAEDRVHRIGQTNTVNVQYVVLRNSYEATRLNAILAKRQRAI